MTDIRLCSRCARPYGLNTNICAECGAAIIPNDDPIVSVGADNSSLLPLLPWNSITAHGRARLLLFALSLCLMFDLLAVLIDFSEREILIVLQGVDSVTPSLQQRADESDTRQAIIGLAQVVVFLITSILFLRWWYRAYRNLNILTDHKTRWSPGWAVGYWFVPFLCLIRPYQIAKDLWVGSTPSESSLYTAHQNLSPSTTIVSMWWFVWIGFGLFNQIMLRDSMTGTFSEPMLHEIIQANAMTIVSDLGGVIQAIFAICLVRGIDLRQETKAAASQAAMSL